MSASAASNRSAALLREIFLVGFAYLIYSQVRGLAGDRVIDAFANGYWIVDFESEIGIFKELAVQTAILSYAPLEAFFNLVYTGGLFPMLLPTAVWLYIKKPHVYTVARNAFLISGAIAVCFFLVLPTAPPRLIGMGFIDTLSQGVGPSYSSIPGVNHFAALPSMHVGWNFLTSVAIYLALAGYRWRFIVLLLPLVMWFSTIVTGNHYFLDGALGVVVAGVALMLALRLQKSDGRQIVELVTRRRAPGSSS